MTNPTNKQIVLDLIRGGLLVQERKRLKFTAPLMRITLGIHLFTAPHTLRNPININSFEEFLIRTLDHLF